MFCCRQALVDDWGFAEAAFRQFAGPCFQQLAAFLKSATELDSQLQVYLRVACAGSCTARAQRLGAPASSSEARCCADTGSLSVPCTTSILQTVTRQQLELTSCAYPTGVQPVQRHFRQAAGGGAALCRRHLAAAAGSLVRRRRPAAHAHPGASLGPLTNRRSPPFLDLHLSGGSKAADSYSALQSGMRHEKTFHNCLSSGMQVLLALQRLLVAMGSGAGAADGFVVPVLRYACDAVGPEALNLLEDGFATWLTALRVAPAPNPQLTDLFPLLAAAMHASTGAPPATRGPHSSTAQFLPTKVVLQLPRLLWPAAVAPGAMHGRTLHQTRRDGTAMISSVLLQST